MASKRVELSAFALQLEPPVCRELADMGEKQPKVYRIITSALFQWIADGCPGDRDKYIPAALTAAERGYMSARMDAHIAKWRSHNSHRRDAKPTTAAAAVVVNDGKTTNRQHPSPEEIRRILRNFGVNPDTKLPYNHDLTFEAAILSEFEELNWKDDNGKPITSYSAYIQKCILPKIQRCSQCETTTGLEAYRMA